MSAFSKSYDRACDEKGAIKALEALEALERSEARLRKIENEKILINRYVDGVECDNPELRRVWMWEDVSAGVAYRWVTVSPIVEKDPREVQRDATS